MATANDIINRAFFHLEIVPAGETALAEDAQEALAVLNEMLDGFELEDINLDHTTLTGAATVNVPRSHIEGLGFCLAHKLAHAWGKTPSPIVIDEKNRALRLFKAIYKPLVKLDIDTGLVRMPSQFMGD